MVRGQEWIEGVGEGNGVGREGWTGLEGKKEGYRWIGMDGIGIGEGMMLEGTKGRLSRGEVWNVIALQRWGKVYAT